MLNKSNSQIEKNIRKRTEEARKTYTFQKNHNPKLPVKYWFQNPPEGLTLFIVFYTQACRWAKCLGCNLPSMVSSKPVSFHNIMRQIDFVFDYVMSYKQKISLRKIILSNNGSILDENTFSTTSLIYFFAKMNIHCPNISVISLESRPEYVDLEELEVLSRAIKEGQTPTQLELAIGFEAYDEKIRNDIFMKGLNLEKFDALVKLLSKYKVRLKTYFMQKPIPGMSEQEAIEDIKKAIDYIDNMANRYNVDINMHINPTYSAYGTQLEEEFLKGNFTPPLLENVRKAVLHAENKKLSVYIGLYDEGLSTPGGSFIREGDEELVNKLEEFNRTQNYELIK
jgi:radical SAM enzyme (TIGR01210 family)